MKYKDDAPIEDQIDSLCFIDYGLSHICEKTQDLHWGSNKIEKIISQEFRGNILFSSFDQLRDRLTDYICDIEALFYVCFYLFYSKKLPWYFEENFQNILENHKGVGSITNLK